MKDMVQLNARRWLAPAVVAVLLMPTIPFCVQMASSLWPGLHYDAVLYSTVAINQDAGVPFKFEAYTPALIERPEGDLGFHGLLSYPLYAAAMGESSYVAYFRTLSAITLLSVWLSALLLYLQTRELVGWSVVVPAAGGWALLAVLTQIQGRPEHLIPLIVVLCELLAYLMRRRPMGVAALRGACGGLVAAVSPAPALLYVVAFALFYFGRLPWERLVKVGALCAAACAATWFGLTLFVFGNSPWEALTGAAGSDIAFSARSLAHQHWLMNPNTPMIGLLYGQALTLLVLAAGRRVWCDRWPILAGVVGMSLFAVLLLVVDATGVKNPFVNYRSLPFLPLWLAFLVSVVLTGPSDGSTWERWWLKINRAAFALFLLATAAGGVMFLYERYREGVAESRAFSQANVVYDELKAQLGPNERIGMDQFGNATDIVLDGPPWRMLSLPPDFVEFTEIVEEAEKGLGVRFAYLIRSPRNMHPPAERFGSFVLVDQSFPKDSPPPKTYGFYIYKREEEGAPPSPQD